MRVIVLSCPLACVREEVELLPVGTFTKFIEVAARGSAVRAFSPQINCP